VTPFYCWCFGEESKGRKAPEEEVIGGQLRNTG